MRHCFGCGAGWAGYTLNNARAAGASPSPCVSLQAACISATVTQMSHLELLLDCAGRVPLCILR